MRKDKPQWGTQVEAVAKEDDGVGMHEMAEALLHAIYEYGFPWISDGSYFEIRLIQRENEQREKKKGVSGSVGSVLFCSSCFGVQIKIEFKKKERKVLVNSGEFGLNNRDRSL